MSKRKRIKCNQCGKKVETTYSHYDIPFEINKCIDCIDGYEFEMRMWNEDKND